MTTSAPTGSEYAETVLDRLDHAFLAAHDPVAAREMRSYMRDQFTFMGIQNAARTAIARDASRHPVTDAQVRLGPSPSGCDHGPDRGRTPPEPIDRSRRPTPLRTCPEVPVRAVVNVSARCGVASY